MRLNIRTVNVLRLATEEKKHSGNSLLTAILVAILTEGTSSVAKTLTELGVTISRLRTHDMWESLLPQPPRPSLKKILQQAEVEARTMQDKIICPIHLLLGIITTDVVIREYLNSGSKHAIRDIAITNYQAKLANKKSQVS